MATSFKDGTLERYESSFFSGSWNEKYYFLKNEKLVQSEAGKEARATKPQNIDLNGATLKLYPDESKPDEIHLTPMGFSVIKLRDASRPNNTSRPKFILEWHGAMMKAIAEAKTKAPADVSNRQSFAAKGRSKYMSVPKDEEDLEKAEQPHEEEHPQLWSVAIARWNLGADGKDWHVLSHGYSTKPGSKRDSDEANTYTLMEKHSGPKLVQSLVSQYERKADKTTPDAKLFPVLNKLPDREDRFRGIAFYNCDPDVLKGQVQLVYVIWCDTASETDVSRGNVSGGTGYGAPRAMELCFKVMEAFKVAFPQEADLTPENCRSFNAMLEKMIDDEQAVKTDIGAHREVMQKARNLTIDNMKLAEGRSDSISNVLDNSKGLKDDSAGYEGKANTLKNKSWMQYYKALLRFLLLMLCFGGILAGLLYNFLGKPGSKD